ncbi:reverse transcriptase (RNA-directed DNA polymerase), partial [Legionella nautarum]
RLPTYKFLGFTCYWGKTRNGYWRLKFKSRRDRFSAKLKEIKQYLRENLTAKETNDILYRVKLIVRGWVNYHGISDNKRRVKSFIDLCKRSLLSWF